MNSDDQNLDDGDWELLLENINDKTCTPIVGSGAVTGGPPEGVEANKWTFEYPIGAALAQEWATQFQYPLDDPTRIERVAQFMSVYYDPTWPKKQVAKRLAEAIPPDFTYENETHRVLAELNLPVYVTSNCDDYLVRALLKDGDKDAHVSICRWNKYIPPDAPAYDYANRDLVPYAIAQKGENGTLTYSTADASYKPTVANPVVCHIHGHMAWPASVVVTEDDYFEFLLNWASAPSELVPPRILEALGASSLLFLGYKLRDWDFRVLLRVLADILKTRQNKHIAVQIPMSGAQAVDAMRAASVRRYLGSYFDTRGKIKVYVGTCQEFVAELKLKRGQR
jgi:hypothetical protein